MYRYCWYCKKEVVTDKLFHSCGQMFISKGDAL